MTTRNITMPDGTVRHNVGSDNLSDEDRRAMDADLESWIAHGGPEIERLTAIVNEVHNWIVCAGIASNEDMAQNFGRIAAITAPGASVDDPTPGGPTAKLTYKLVSSTGYEVEGEFAAITPEQYGAMVGLLHGTLKAVPK